jgi:DNA recombination protein RmuC
MDLLSLTIGMALGLLLGLLFGMLFKDFRMRSAREIAAELFQESEGARQAQVNELIEHVKASFGSLSLDALSKSSAEFLKLASGKLESERQVSVQELEARKGLIDQQLLKMATELNGIGSLMKELEKDRVEKFGELTKHLKLAGEQTVQLMQTTAVLREALASTKVRGLWGERMAEDILRLAGFKENINYLKQKQIEGVGSRPDFTFLLPDELTLNMDVKFPLDNYVRLLESADDKERSKYRTDFLRDVKTRIKEITTRDYINAAQKTVDCVLLFIPNEQIYAFIHEQDGLVIEEAMRHGVVCCSPASLFAVLAVIRRAIDSFSLGQMSNEMLTLFGSFKKQWDEFLKKLELLGRRIDDVQKEYEVLTTSRKRQLERPLRRIEEIRNKRGLEVAAEDE